MGDSLFYASHKVTTFLPVFAKIRETMYILQGNNNTVAYGKKQDNKKKIVMLSATKHPCFLSFP